MTAERVTKMTAEQMKEQKQSEAVIKSLQWVMFNLGETTPHTFPHAIKVYVKRAIEEIETLEKENETLKNPPSKQVNYESDGYADGVPVYDVAFCPNCEWQFDDGLDTWKSNYCPNCGQKLDWGD